MTFLIKLIILKLKNNSYRKYKGVFGNPLFFPSKIILFQKKYKKFNSFLFFIHKGREGVLAKIANTGGLHPKGVPLSDFNMNR